MLLAFDILINILSIFAVLAIIVFSFAIIKQLIMPSDGRQSEFTFEVPSANLMDSPIYHEGDRVFRTIREDGIVLREVVLPLNHTMKIPYSWNQLPEFDDHSPCKSNREIHDVS